MVGCIIILCRVTTLTSVSWCNGFQLAVERGVKKHLLTSNAKMLESLLDQRKWPACPTKALECCHGYRYVTKMLVWYKIDGVCTTPPVLYMMHITKIASTPPLYSHGGPDHVGGGTNVGPQNHHDNDLQPSAFRISVWNETAETSYGIQCNAINVKLMGNLQ